MSPLRLFSFLLPLIAGLSLAQEQASSSKHESDTKPNIILINVDDLGWAELGAYGQQKAKTPHLDKLASEGQRWTQFYSGAPVCAPSRNVLMTGRHTGCVDVQDLKRVDPKEVWDDLKGDWPMREESYTLPEAMKKAGYATGVFGKWGLGEYGTGGAPDKHGIDNFFGYTDHRLCHTYYPRFLWKNGQKVFTNYPGIPGHAQKPEGPVNADDYRGQNHSSELIIAETLNFIDDKAKNKEPFFVYYAPLEAHVAMQPLQSWVDTYPPEWDTEPYRGNKGYLPHPRPRAGYAAMISQMDSYVGKITDLLKQHNIEENTIIMFTSDNGTTHDVGGVDHKFFNSVADLKGLKGQLYEGGIRVPYIVVWKGKIKPGTIDQPGYGADIMPTLCSLVGANPGEPTGIDLSPVLVTDAKDIKNRRPMVWTGGGYGGQAAVRIGDKKVLRRQLFAPQAKQPCNWEVYDIQNDPEERNDIADKEQDLVRQAIDILDKEYKASEGFRSLRYKDPEHPGIKGSEESKLPY